jgi:hypothetical protein
MRIELDVQTKKNCNEEKKQNSEAPVDIKVSVTNKAREEIKSQRSIFLQETEL